MKKKIIHLRNKCIGCNFCVEIAPGNWFMDMETGKSKLRRSEEKNGLFIAEISEPETEKNLRAAISCPAKIIKIIDKGGKKMY